MISFNNLGNLGRLGNQMFQYAAIKGIAKKHGYEFAIPPKSEFGKKDQKVFNEKCDIYDVFNLSHNKIMTTNFDKLSETNLNFDKDIFDTCPDNVDIDGYFQSEKYFKHIESEIKTDFTFSEEVVFDAKQFLRENYYQTEVISLHIRRGDYLDYSDHHPTCSIDYYKTALMLLPPKSPVIIFTNDDEWCNKHDIFDEDRFVISYNNDVSFDLCLMTLCDYHIIANSSFSWWGSWLSNSKLTIAPKKWFGPGYSGWKLEDRVLENWVLL